MAYAITNGSGWATTGDYQSDYQCLGLWLTDDPENDRYLREEMYRQVPGLNVADEALQLPDHEQIDDAGGLCLHPMGSSYCRSHSSHGGDNSALTRNGAGAMHSDCGIYSSTISQNVNTQMLAHTREEKKRPASLPPAMERYVDEHQSHELFALRHSNSSSTHSQKSRTCERKMSHRAGVDRSPGASRKSVRSKGQSASSGGKHGHSG